MSKTATVTITIDGTPMDFVVKTQSAAKRIIRLVNSMQLPNVGHCRVSVHDPEVAEVSEVLRTVFEAAHKMSDYS